MTQGRGCYVVDAQSRGQLAVSGLKTTMWLNRPELSFPYDVEIETRLRSIASFLLQPMALPRTQLVRVRVQVW